MVVLFALVVAGLLLWLLSPVADRSAWRPHWRSQVDWAAERLATDGFRIEPDTDEIILERNLYIDGVHCLGGTVLTFGAHGRLRRATLAEHCTLEGLPLTGGTEVAFDADESELIEATLRAPTLIGRVPCAAGHVYLRVGRHRRQVTQAVLSRDCVLRGSLRRSGIAHRIHCRGGTTIRQRPGTLCAHLEQFTPRTEEWAWGLRCAAEHAISTVERSGVLADDHVFDDITFPAGSSFSHDIDEDLIFGGYELQVTLSRSTPFMDHRLPVGTCVQPCTDLVRPPGRLGRWLASWSTVRSPRLTVHRSAPWSIGGVRISAGTRVSIFRDGGFRYLTDRDVVLEGVRYPEGSWMEHGSDGQLLRWQAGPRPCGRPHEHHPYRAPSPS